MQPAQPLPSLLALQPAGPFLAITQGPGQAAGAAAEGLDRG